MSFFRHEGGEGKLVGESLGGWIAGLYRGGDRWRRPLDTSGEAGACRCGGLKQDKPIPDLNPSSLAAMRGMMKRFSMIRAG